MKPRNGFTAAFSGVRGVEGKDQEPAFGQCLGIQSGGLFFHGSERAAHGNGGKLAFHVPGYIQVGGERYTVAVVESNFRVVYFFHF